MTCLESTRDTIMLKIQDKLHFALNFPFLRYVFSQNTDLTNSLNPLYAWFLYTIETLDIN